MRAAVPAPYSSFLSGARADDDSTPDVASYPLPLHGRRGNPPAWYRGGTSLEPINGDWFEANVTQVLVPAGLRA